MTPRCLLGGCCNNFRQVTMLELGQETRLTGPRPVQPAAFMNSIEGQVDFPSIKTYDALEIEMKVLDAKHKIEGGIVKITHIFLFHRLPSDSRVELNSHRPHVSSSNPIEKADHKTKDPHYVPILSQS